MLVFQPCLTATLPHVADRNEVIICLDCSNSMEGVTFTNARKIALHALSLLGKKQKVNIIQFGTGEHARVPARKSSSLLRPHPVGEARAWHTESWARVRLCHAQAPCVALSKCFKFGFLSVLICRLRLSLPPVLPCAVS